jgi:hypothetical protein
VGNYIQKIIKVLRSTELGLGGEEKILKLIKIELTFQDVCNDGRLLAMPENVRLG